MDIRPPITTAPRPRLEFDRVRISIASPDKIKSWSWGEVTKPETINYRTFKPEKDGLFCAKIFGPINDYECLCGKYKRMKYRGIICERCGVEVTKSKVRRERMGHIQLASPVAHIWFFKSPPSRIGLVLDLSIKDLEKVLYFESYIVIDPADTPLKEKQLLNEEEFKDAQEKYGDKFEASIGAEAIKILLEKINIQKEAERLRKLMKKETSQQRKLRYAKRLRVFKALKRSGQPAGVDGPRRRPGHPARPAPPRPPRRRPLRHLRPQRPLPPGHQPQQPAQEAHRAQGPRAHHPQREADAPGGRRRPVRQRQARPRPPRRQPPAPQVPERGPARQAGAVPPEPPRQARRLLGPVRHRRRPRAQAQPVRPAQEDGPRALQAVHLQQAREGRPRPERQGRPGVARAGAARGLGLPRGGRPRAPHLPQPRAHPAPAGHPGLRAPARRGQGHPDPPARLRRLQRRLRRRPDGRPHPALGRGPDRGPDPDAVDEQHPLARPRPAPDHPQPGHGPRLLLPDPREEGPERGGAHLRHARGGPPGHGERRYLAPEHHQAALQRAVHEPGHVLRRPGRHDLPRPGLQERARRDDPRPDHLQQRPAQGLPLRQRDDPQEGHGEPGLLHLPQGRPQAHGHDPRRHEGARLQVRHPGRLLPGHRRLRHPRREEGPRREGREGGPGDREASTGTAPSPRASASTASSRSGARSRTSVSKRHDRRDEADQPRGQGAQPALRHVRLRLARQQAADPPAGRDARPDVEALGRDPGDAHRRQPPRGPERPPVLHLDPRRPQGPGRHGPQDGQFRLPDPQARRRLPGGHRRRARLRHAQGHQRLGHRRERRDHRALHRPDRRPDRPRAGRPPRHRRDDRRHERGDHREGRPGVPEPGHRAGQDPLGPDLRVQARHLPALLRPLAGLRQDGRARRGLRHRRRPVDRRARHPADHADLPRRRHRHGRRRAVQDRGQERGRPQVQQPQVGREQGRDAHRRQPERQHRRPRPPRPRGRALPGALRRPDPRPARARRSSPARPSPSGTPSTPSS